MSKSPDRLSPKDFLRKYGLPLLLAPAILFYLRSADSQEAWAASVQNVEQGTIPEPTRTPVPEEELQQPILAFETEIQTDPGVVVAFVKKEEADGSSLFDGNLDLAEWGPGIAPVSNSGVVTEATQFADGDETCFVIGQKAREYWDTLIAQAEAEGDQETANYLRTHYPELQGLTQATITIGGSYSSQGEVPKEFSIALTADENGSYTAISETKYPSYMQQAPDGELTVAGEEFGLVQPLTETVTSSNIFSVTIDTKGVTPRIKVSSDEEEIEIKPVAPVALAGESTVIQNLDELGVSFTDNLMTAKDAWYQEQISDTVSVAGMQALPEPPLALPENDRRLSVTIDGSQVKEGSIYQSTFTARNRDSFAITAEDIQPTHLFSIGIVDNQIVITDLSGTGDLPTITVNGESYPPEDSTPDNQDPDTETPPDDSTPPDNEAPDKPLPVGSSTYLPSVINKE